MSQGKSEKYIGLNENDNINLWDMVKTMLRGNFVATLTILERKISNQ